MNFGLGSPINCLSAGVIVPSPSVSSNLKNPGAAPSCVAEDVTSASDWNRPTNFISEER